jgi:hypothetical protein
VSSSASYTRGPGLNLGSETGYPKGFLGFPQSLQANAGIVP